MSGTKRRDLSPVLDLGEFPSLEPDNEEEFGRLMATADDAPDALTAAEDRRSRARFS